MSDAKKQIIDELYKPARKNFKRRRTIIKGLDDLWQMDLAEFGQYASQNKGYRYILVVIDCFSKFLWTRALKTKSAEEVSKAMGSVLQQSQRHPHHIQSDLGKEFYNTKFQALLTKYNINHYSTFTTKKASMAERVIRTLKEKLYKAFNLRGTYRWIDILDEVTESYNSTTHSTTKMKPKDITKMNEDSVLKSSYTHVKKMDKVVFGVGDIVRISKEKALFEKGYTPRWSTELFRVVKVKLSNPTTYLLEDMQGKPISGGFYVEELQKTNSPDIYLVEKVLRRKGQKMYVKWLGLDKTHNSWISSSDIK